MIVSMTFLTVTLAQRQVQAVGLTVGAATWYSWWGSTPADGTTYKPGLFYGPVIGFDLNNKWSVSEIFLTGNFSNENPNSIPVSTVFRRYDSDTTVSYNFNRWIKFFGGLKYIRFDYNSNGSKVSVFGGSDLTYSALGPALGAGLTLPISDSLFLLANCSVMYCFGEQTYNGVVEKEKDYGFNSSVTLAYYFDSIETTVSAGIRYQYLYSVYEGDYDDNSTTFYGLTLMATHHFSFNPE